MDDGGIPPPDKHAERRSLIVSAVLMLLSCLCFSLMGLAIKIASQSYTSFQQLLYRNIASVGYCIIALMLKREPILGPRAATKTTRLYLAVYGLSVAITMAMYMYVINVLPLSDATTLCFTSPIFSSIAASVFLHEKYLLRDFVTTLFSIAGIILVAQPTFMGFPSHDPAGKEHTFTVAYIIAVVYAAVSGGICFVILRLTGHSPDPLHFVFSLSACALVVGIIGSLAIDNQHTAWAPSHTALQILAVFAIGICGFLGQVTSTAALESAPHSSLVAINNLNYSQIILRLALLCVLSCRGCRHFKTNGACRSFVWTAALGSEITALSIVGALLVATPVFYHVFQYLLERYCLHARAVAPAAAATPPSTLPATAAAATVDAVTAVIAPRKSVGVGRQSTRFASLQHRRDFESIHAKSTIHKH